MNLDSTATPIFPESYSVMIDGDLVSESHKPIHYTRDEAIREANRRAPIADCHAAVLDWYGTAIYQALVESWESKRRWNAR